MDESGPDLRRLFAERLATLLALSELSLEQVAERANKRRQVGEKWRVTAQRVSDWQSGSHLPHSDRAFDAVIWVLIQRCLKVVDHGTADRELVSETAWRRLLRSARSRHPRLATGNDLGASGHSGPGLTRPGSIRSATAAPTALDQLPPPVAGFTGRNGELAILAGQLDPAGPGNAVVITAVAGLAGVGKTALAVQAGHAAVSEGWFAGGVLFIDLHGYDEEPVRPLQALDALLRALGVAAQDIPPGVEERAALYRSFLAQVTSPVLVIADNATSEAQVRLLLPGTGRHRVLVTSRRTLAGLDARLVDVTVLDDSAGMKLLDAALRTARPGDGRISSTPEIAARLAGLCGGLPLALQITAAILKSDPELTTGEVAQRLSREEERLQALRYDDGGGSSAPSVAAALALSYRGLDDVSARVFRLLSVAPGPDVSTAAIQVMTGLPAEEARRVLRGLLQAHLVEHAPHRTERWRMHDLVRLYAQRLSDEHETADNRSQALDELLDYYLRMATITDMLVRGSPLPGAPRIGRAHALAWFDAERASLVAAAIMAAKSDRTEAALHLPIVMAEYLDWRRQFDDKLVACAVSRDAARRLHDKVSEAMALNGMSIAFRETGRLEEALTACQGALVVFREHGRRQYEGVALANLGNALVVTGRVDEAIAMQENAVAVFAEIGDRAGEGMALCNLGIALYEAGRFEEAIDAEQNMAAVSREMGDRHREAMALNNLGHAFQGTGRVEEAITAHRDSAAFFHETGDPHGQTDALRSLAAVLDVTGRFEEAIAVYRDLAALFRETGDRISESRTLENLAATLTKVQRHREAIAVYRDLAALFRETGDRTGEGMALVNLGAALIDERQFNEAITACLQAAEILQETGDRSGEGRALSNIGYALMETGRFEEAITACQNALNIFRQIGDEKYEETALNNLERARLGA